MKNNNPSKLVLLHNVTQLIEMMDGIINRSEGLPGLGVFCGPSGYGKSSACAVAANIHGAHYVQLMSIWTIKDIYLAIHKEIFGSTIAPPKTTSRILEAIGEELTLSRRPLIIDEADYIVTDARIAAMRDIYEAARGGSVILIGEEGLPVKLKQYERVYNRVHSWLLANPVTLDECRELAASICEGVTLAPDLLQAFLRETKGVTRLVCSNIDHAKKLASTLGKDSLNLADWTIPFSNGRAPSRGGN